MSGSGSAQSTPSSQQTAPWAPTQPFEQNEIGAIQSAQNAYNPTPFAASTVAPLSGNTMSAITSASNASNNSQAFGNQTAGLYSQFMNPGAGVSGVAGNTYNTLATGGGPSAAGVAQPLIAAAQQQNPAMAMAAQGAAGVNLNNPMLNDMYNNAAKNLTAQYSQGTAPSLEAQFAAAGRTGSGAYAAADQAAKSNYNQGLSSLATNLYGNAFNTEQQVQQQDLGLQAQLGQQQFGNQATAAGLVQQGMGQDVQSQLAGAAGLQGQAQAGAGTQMQAAQLLNSIPQQQVQTAVSSLAASGLLDQNQQAVLTDAVQKYYAGNNEALTTLQQFLPLINSIAGLGGSTNAQTTSYGPSPIATSLSGAASGASIGALAGPYGAAAGGVIGGVAGLFSH